MAASVPIVPLKKGGRRGEFTKAQVENALTEANGFVTSAAKRLGCNPKTVYRYMERYPSLKEVLADAREDALDLAESKLMKAINEGNLTAIIFFLKTRGKSRGYSERRQFGHPTGDEPVEFTLKLGDRVVKED